MPRTLKANRGRAIRKITLRQVERKLRPLVRPFIRRKKKPRPDTGSYRDWVRQYDSFTSKDRVAFCTAIAEFPECPLISIVLSVHTDHNIWLPGAINSVRKQIYPHWELLIAGDASAKSHVQRVLKRYGGEERRIRSPLNDRNSNIAIKLNSALDLATGTFVAFLDGDGELSEHALFWVIAEILKNSDVDLIYSDEDKLDEDGSRFDPYFKSDWNPALLLSQNMFSHLGVFRRSLVKRAGQFREGFEGSQYHDLVLRCAELTSRERIRHIPRILYHERASRGTASNGEPKSKPFAHAWEAGARAIEQHLVRCGTPGRIERVQDQFYQVHYRIHDSLPKVSLIIPSALSRNLLLRCIDGILTRSSYPNFEIMLALNESCLLSSDQEKYIAKIRNDPRVTVLTYIDQNFNYSKINNWAIRQCNSSIVCTMNDDVEVIAPDWLEKLVVRVQLPGVAAAGALLRYPNNTIQHAGVILGINGVAGHPFARIPAGSAGYFGRAALEQDLSCVTAACLVVRREAFDALGGFNEKLAIAYNDVDLCIRLRKAGWRIIWTPTVELYHHEISFNWTARLSSTN